MSFLIGLGLQFGSRNAIAGGGGGGATTQSLLWFLNNYA